MNLEELIAEARSDADDRADPPLLGTDDLIRWFNEAEAEAAIRARLLFSDEYTIDVLQDVSGYAFDKLFIITRASLYRIAGATPVDYPLERTLRLVTREEIDSYCPDWRTERGCPEYLIKEDRRIFIPSIVDRAYYLRLEGYRTPLVKMEDDSQVPEIAEIHHRGLVNWALFRGFSRPDADMFNPQKAAQAEARFEREFGKRPNADMLKRQQANRPHHNEAW